LDRRGTSVLGAWDGVLPEHPAASDANPEHLVSEGVAVQRWDGCGQAHPAQPEEPYRSVVARSAA
jgi:hypothetical protein